MTSPLDRIGQQGPCAPCDHCEQWFPIAKMHETINPRTGQRDSILCDNCAQRAWESRQEDIAAGGGPDLDEQHRRAWEAKKGER